MADRLNGSDEALSFFWRQHSSVDKGLDLIHESVQIIERCVGFVLVQILDRVLQLHDQGVGLGLNLIDFQGLPLAFDFSL